MLLCSQPSGITRPCGCLRSQRNPCSRPVAGFLVPPAPLRCNTICRTVGLGKGWNGRAPSLAPPASGPSGRRSRGWELPFPHAGAVFAACFIRTCAPLQAGRDPALGVRHSRQVHISPCRGQGPCLGTCFSPASGSISGQGTCRRTQAYTPTKNQRVSFFFSFLFFRFFFSFLKDLSLHLLCIYASADLSQYPLREREGAHAVWGGAEGERASQADSKRGPMQGPISQPQDRDPN